MKLPPHRERTATHTQLDDWEPPVSPNAAQPSSWCWLCLGQPWDSSEPALPPHVIRQPPRPCSRQRRIRACF